VSYFNDDMGASLDRWITGNYGEDRWGDDGFCWTCSFGNGDGDILCTCEKSTRYEELVDEEDWCDYWQGR
jgi:hypothetical protein